MKVLKSKPFRFYVSVEKLHSESRKLKENPLKQGVNPCKHPGHHMGRVGGVGESLKGVENLLRSNLTI